MILSVKQTEHGLVVLVQKGKRGRFNYETEYEWVEAGQDELNEVCRRLAHECRGTQITYHRDPTFCDGIPKINLDGLGR